MFIIQCPWCGARDQAEFSAHGQAHIARPENPDELDDQDWAQYVFYRDSLKGWYKERWVHNSCGRWFNVLRHTGNDQIAQSYAPSDPQPEIPEE